MESQPPLAYFSLVGSQRLRVVASLGLLAGGVTFAGMLCAAGRYREAAAVSMAALCASFLVAAPVSVEAVLITWFAATPLASFFIRFPTDRSLVTFDRVVFALVVVILLLNARRTRSETEDLSSSARRQAGFSVTKFEVAWAVLSIAALANAAILSNKLPAAARTAVDTFALPLIAFYVGRRHFDAARSGRWLLLAGMGLAFVLFATGAVELVTGSDLFQYRGSEIEREGERRVNGPLLADSSYAIICLILFLFLQAAPRIFRLRLDRTGKLVYAGALAASALGALLPLFRVVAFALVACWLLSKWLMRKRSREPARRAHRALPHGLVAGAFIALIVVAAGLWAAANIPSTFGRLSDERSAFGRLATWRAAAEIAVENPFFGVGLGNYGAYFDEKRFVERESFEELLDTRASNTPHSNLLWIASEMGVGAVGLYIMANVYLLLLGWRAVKTFRGTRRAAAACYLALLMAYWIPGFTLTSGGYSDLNLYLLFLLGALSSVFSSSGRSMNGYAEAGA